MDHGSSSLADQLAACQQRIRELEQRDAQRQAIIAEQQEVISRQEESIASYQEQLTKAAEQLRLFKRMLFGQRRERYAPSPDQKPLFVPQVVEGLNAREQTTEEPVTEAPPPRPRRKPRRPRIEFPQFWEHRRTEYRLPESELPYGCCGQQRIITREHVTIAPGDTAALEALLPDRWVAAHPEHRLEQREEESREAQARRRRKRAARRAEPPNRRW
jgi:uncharacterized coiled-coil protein SlyX